jgi:PAS domain S-box-containing protein
MADSLLTTTGVRRRAEDRRRLEVLVESLPTIAFVTDPAGRFPYLNQQGLAFLGRQDADDAGDWWFTALHPDDHAETVRIWTNAVATGLDCEHAFRMRRHDGQFRWFLGRAGPVREPDGAPIGWLVLVTDVEGLRRLDMQLGALTHDLNNALAGLSNALVLLDRSEPSENQRRYLDVARTSVERAGQLAQQLIGLTRLGS